MAGKSLSIKKIFKDSFATYKKHIIMSAVLTVLVFGIVLLAVITAVIIALIMPDFAASRFLHAAEAVVAIAVYFTVPVLLAVFLLMAISGFMAASKGRTPKVKDFLPSGMVLLRAFVFAAAFVAIFMTVTFAFPVTAISIRRFNTPEELNTAVMVLSGYPMIIATAVSFFLIALFMIKYSFTFFALLEKYTLKDSILKSIKVTDGRVTQIIKIYLMLFVLNVIAFSTVVGVLAAAPFSLIVLVHTYYELKLN